MLMYIFKIKYGAAQVQGNFEYAWGASYKNMF